MTNSRKYDRPLRYEIKIHGRLEPKWAKWFDDFQLLPLENDNTVLVGVVADQAALHGLLTRIRNLGLPLLALTCEADSLSSIQDAAGDISVT